MLGSLTFVIPRALALACVSHCISTLTCSYRFFHEWCCLTHNKLDSPQFSSCLWPHPWWVLVFLVPRASALACVQVLLGPQVFVMSFAMRGKVMLLSIFDILKNQPKYLFIYIFLFVNWYHTISNIEFKSYADYDTTLLLHRQRIPTAAYAQNYYNNLHIAGMCTLIPPCLRLPTCFQLSRFFLLLSWFLTAPGIGSCKLLMLEFDWNLRTMKGFF